MMNKTLLASCIFIALNTYTNTSLAVALQDNNTYQDQEFADDEFGDFYGGEEFISLATGTKKSVSKAPSVASVITSQDISYMGVNNLHEVIESVTGIHVYPSNLNRMNPSYSIRGIHTGQNPQVLVLVNGERTTQNWSGAKWDLFNLGTELIDRIEVIRGPGSAVHGADAFSGVINVITKGFESPIDSDFGVKAGSFGSRTLWMNNGITLGKTDIVFNAQKYQTDGDDSRIVPEDALHSLGLGFLSNAPMALDTRLDTTDLRLSFKNESIYGHFWYLENEGGVGAGAAQALSLNDNAENRTFSAKFGFKKELSDDWKIDLWASYQDYEEDTFFTIFPPGMLLPRAFDPNTGAPIAFTNFTDGLIGRPILKDQNVSFEGTAFYSGLDKHNIRLSIGHTKNKMTVEEFKNFGPLAQDFTSDTRDGVLTDVTGTAFIFSPNVDRDVFYVSVQDEWKLGKDWELTAGLRYDDYSDFGSTINPRLALVWQAKHNFTVKGIYGRAFRAPSFSELYAINNPVIFGNPDLKPETINTYEIAFDYRPNFDWKLLFNIFSYKADNLIVYTPQGDGSNLANNAAEQTGYGAEFEAFWTVNEDVQLKAGYSVQRAEDGITNIDIPDAPQQSANVTIHWDLSDKWHLNLDNHWILNRERASSDLRAKIDNYSWANLNLIHEFGNNLSVALSVRNLFDNDAFEPSDGQISTDFPLEERGYWLKLSYKL